MWIRLLSFMLICLSESALLAESFDRITEAKIIASERISLVVGEQRSLHLGDPLRVNVSRRGIVHLIEMKQDVWRMTALRAGIIAIEVHKRGGAKNVIYVEVKPKPNQTAKRELEVNQLADVIETIPKIFHVKATVELLEEQAAEVVGNSGKAQAELDFIKGTIDGKVLGGFEMRERKFSRRILGEPAFSIHEDEDALIKSGGEALQDRTDEEGRHRDIWHEYGLSLSLKVHEFPDKTIRSDVLFALKSPSGDQKRFSLNHIQTRTSLKAGERTLIGSVDLASTDRGEDRDSLLSRIPIIGPLFQKSTSNESTAVVQLWLEVNSFDNHAN